MQNVIYTVVSNRAITVNGLIYKMRLRGEVSAITAPGQFVNLKLDGFYLRRPISVCDVHHDGLTIIYKVVGQGTAAMAKLGEGAEIDTLVGLGNGYDLAPAGDRPLLCGGGVGVPPLYYLARKLIAEGKKPVVLLGFNTADEVFLADEFRTLGCSVSITTVDGSVGTKGFVTDLMRGLSYTHFYTCGPEPMLKAVSAVSTTSGQLSFEARMGCGFGACMGCSCKTLTGNKRICREGPVMRKEEIIWEK